MTVRKTATVAVPSTLLAIAALHAAWARGSSWPAADRRALSERVLAQGERDGLEDGMPPAAATWAVVVALTAAAGAVAAAGAGVRSRWLHRATWALAAVLAARSVAYVPSDLADGGPQDAYQRLDLELYAPLCLALAAGTAVVARGAAR